MPKRDDWLNDPEYIKLVEFLVEKTKEVKEVLSVTELTREFKKHSNSEQKFRCLECRVLRFRSKIHKMPHLDIETKVNLMFGLSASVDRQFLKELRKKAEVTVDDFNRITNYKKNVGGLKLKGIHGPRKAEVSNDQFLEFLAKKVEETKGIIPIRRLAKQLKAETGSSQHDYHLQKRFREATKQIYESELFDEDMKVKMIFATSTVVEDYALKELRENATVVVDDDNRIIKYKKKDGSLNLKRGDIRRVSRVSLNKKQKKKRDDTSDDEGDSEEEDEESNDDSGEEEEAMDVTTRSGRISKKRFTDASLFNNEDDVESSSPRNERSKSSNAPTTSNKKRKTSEHTNESVGKKKKTVEAITTEEEESQERAPEDRHDDDYSFDVSYQPHEEQRVKLEPFGGPLNDDTTRRHIINNGENFVEEIPAPTENFVAPKYEEMLMDVKMEEEPDVIILNDPINKEMKSAEDLAEILDDSLTLKNLVQQDSTALNDIEKEHTSLVLILQTLNDFIDILNLSVLSDLQKKIQEKLEEYRSDSFFFPETK